MTILLRLLSWLLSILCQSYHILFQLSFFVLFLHSLHIAWLTWFSDMKKLPVEWMIQFSYNMAYQLVEYFWVTTTNVMNLFFFINPFLFFYVTTYWISSKEVDLTLNPSPITIISSEYTRSYIFWWNKFFSNSINIIFTQGINKFLLLNTIPLIFLRTFLLYKLISLSLSSDSKWWHFLI